MSRHTALTVSRSKRGITIKASGAAAMALFERIATGVVSLADQAVTPPQAPKPPEPGATHAHEAGDVARG